MKFQPILSYLIALVLCMSQVMSLHQRGWGHCFGVNPVGVTLFVCKIYPTQVGRLEPNFACVKT